MKLTFLGTRGEIRARTRQHRRHSALQVAYRGKAVIVDCGGDWLHEMKKLRPKAIVLTHEHPDHAWGLKRGAPCPVYAPKRTWDTLENCQVADRRVIGIRKPLRIGRITFEAFTVEHSVRAPAVGYRISAGSSSLFYVPDVVYIHQRKAALHDVNLYVGDGATLTRSFVRKRGDRLIGHAPVRTQLTWCHKEGVRRALITHCGSQIVEGDERRLKSEINDLARERGIEAGIAHDGMGLVLRANRKR